MSDLEELERRIRRLEDLTAKLTSYDGMRWLPGLNVLGQSTEIDGNLTVTSAGNITLDSLATVDGVDISAFKAAYDIRDWVSPPIMGWKLNGAVATQRNLQMEIDFRDAVVDEMLTSVFMPPAWAGRTMTVALIWRPSVAQAANVFWEVNLFNQTDGQAEVVSSIFAVGAFSAATNTNWRVATLTLNGALANNVNNSMGLRIDRWATHGSDTFTGTAYLGGVKYYVT